MPPAQPPLPPPAAPSDLLRTKIEIFLSDEPGEGGVWRGFTQMSPLTPAESSSSSSDSRSQTGFASLPSFSTFLSYNPEAWKNGDFIQQRKKRALEVLEKGMVVKGTVRSIKPYGLLIQVEQVCEHLDGSMPRFTAEFNRIHELDLKALCHVTELSEKYITDLTVEMPDAYHVGDVIKALVTSVNPAAERIKLSVLHSRHATDGDTFLGLSRSPLRTSEAEAGDNEMPSYNDRLRRDRNFTNPYALEHMVSAFSLEELGTMFKRPPELTDGDYEKLRAWQNVQWASETVEQGIGLAKQGKYQEAMKCYNQALEVDPHHRDAFVARGAAYANRSQLPQAIKEFETALRIDPTDANARKYLQATRLKLEEQMKAADQLKESEAKKAVAEEEGKESDDKIQRLKSLLEKEERRRKKKKKRKREKEKDKKHGRERSSSRKKGKEKDRDSRKREKSTSRKHKKRRSSYSSSSSTSTSSYSSRSASPSSATHTGTGGASSPAFPSSP